VIAQLLQLGEVTASSAASPQAPQAAILARFDAMLRPEFWLRPALEIGDQLATLIPRLLVAAALLIAVFLGYRIARRVLFTAMGNRQLDPALRELLGRALKWCVIGFGLTLAAHQAGIEITALLAGASIFGTAVGFAAEETIANFIAAIAIACDKPFCIGQRIGIGDTVGVVEEITFRSTRLLLGSGEIVVHPNRYMTSCKLINYALHERVRVIVPFRIDRDQSIDRTRVVLLSMTVGDPRVRAEPAPQVFVTAIANGLIELSLECWVDDDANQGVLMQEYIERGKKAFEEWGIRIPVARKQVLLDSDQHLARSILHPLLSNRDHLKAAS
jgi:small conductance mechanosensitive channel